MRVCIYRHANIDMGLSPENGTKMKLYCWCALISSAKGVPTQTKTTPYACLLSLVGIPQKMGFPVGVPFKLC